MNTAENKLFPVFLKLENFRVLIVGGGKVALEKVNAILSNSPATAITLVATEIGKGIRDSAQKHPNLHIHERSFQNTDLLEKDLIILAVNNPRLSRSIRILAKEKGILTNVADLPEQCDFYMASIVQKGQIKIAISTNGKSPTLAKRIRETFDEAFPYNINESVQHLTQLRQHLSGDFSNKVNQLNRITEALASKPALQRRNKQKRILLYSLSIIGIFITGYLIAWFLPPTAVGKFGAYLIQSVDASLLWFMLAGFTAQMIDGALGMAYGITATTFLLSFGIAPAASSCSVHAAEVVTSGVSGLMHLKFKNVNTRLFRSLLLPGVLGAVTGAYILSMFSGFNSFIVPAVSIYTLLLGFIILLKAIKKDRIRQRIKRIFPLAFSGGFLDAIGGGGWGPIVSSTLIARGRHPRYTIGSVNLAEFFIALSSSITFFTLIGIQHWTVIAGLILGGAVAAPIASYLSSKIPAKAIMILVGIVAIVLSVKRLFF